MAARTTEKDLGAIVPADGKVTVDGVECRVRRINLLELASLLRVVTAGAGPVLASLGDQEFDPDQMMGLVLLSLPNAAPQFVEFVRQVLEPVDPDQVPDDETWLLNPTPEATLDILGVIVAQEKDDWRALVGKAQKMWDAMIVPLLPRPEAAKATLPSTG